MKMMNNLLILLGLIITIHSSLSVASETNFFVVAHEDDWQLFMNPNVYKNMQGIDKKVVIIHTTAGDAGNFLGTGGTPKSYYLAREEGALRAIRFLVNTDGGGRGLHEKSRVNFQGHNLMRYVYANTRAYFLRLPDGGIKGLGYDNGTGHYESLKRLYEGSESQIHAIDGSAVYSGWHDVVNTLAAIVESESSQSTSVSFNLHDTNPAINPRDHLDHIYTALAMQQVASAKPCVNQNLFLGYFSASMPFNVTRDDLYLDIGTWAVTTSGISDNYHQSTWGIYHNIWLGKNYFRTLPGAKACAIKENLALRATASASSENATTEQTAQKAIDNVISGSPANHKAEWVTQHQGAGAYLTLTWNTAVTVSHVVLYDRPNLNDQITAARLWFDNDQQISVSALHNDGSAVEVSFNPITTKSIKLQIDHVSSSTTNVGLSEIQIF